MVAQGAAAKAAMVRAALPGFRGSLLMSRAASSSSLETLTALQQRAARLACA
jgi:hypothetical protein